MNQHVSHSTSIYHELSTDTNEIRLLEVGPDLNDGRIECRLSTGSLKTASFVVLSYRWGTQAATNEIVLNGQPFYIRQNLWDFLSVIRHQPGMALWIDALCINQDDLNERNQQVRIMGQIFQSAAMVLSWLGAANDGFEDAFDLMASVSTSTASGDESDQLPICKSGRSEDDLWRCVAELCNLPYWGRIWVVQEILLSSNNYLLCGQKTLPWQVFANFISLVDVRFACPPQHARTIHESTAKLYAASKPYVMVPQSLQWRVGNALKHDFGKAWDAREYNLFRILTMFGSRDCTDPLDHVYALLSLTEEAGKFPIKYGIEKMELFVTLLQFCADSAVQWHNGVESALILDQHSQRAFIRNTKFIAEVLELISTGQRAQPYYGPGMETRGPSPRPNPWFPGVDRDFVLQCTAIIPGNEPPMLRSNTLQRAISAVTFDHIVHIDESSSWLLCRQHDDSAKILHVTGVITIKDGVRGRGFRVLEPGRLASAKLAPAPACDVGEEGKLGLFVTSDTMLHFLKIVVLGQQPS